MRKGKIKEGHYYYCVSDFGDEFILQATKGKKNVRKVGFGKVLKIRRVKHMFTEVGEIIGLEYRKWKHEIPESELVFELLE